MKVVAAGAYKLGQGNPLQGYIYATDAQHPAGNTPFNIERVDQLGLGLATVTFTVPTERPGLASFQWFIQGPNWYDTSDIEWINPYQIRVLGHVGDQPWDNPFKILAIQQMPDGATELPPEFILYGTFDPAGTLIDNDPDHPLGGFPARGFLSTINYGGGSYDINLSVDFYSSCYSWFVWYEPPPGAPSLAVTHAPNSTRVARFMFVNPAGGSGLPQGKWHVAAYKFGDDLPTSLSIYDISTQPYGGGFQPGVTIGLIGYAYYADGRRGQLDTMVPTWTSADEGLFIVNPNNTLTAVAEGTATLTMEWKGLSTTQQVTVYPP
jgi:hypothetical protein